MSQDLKIGFIGQGFIGKNFADDFESRGYHIVRFSKRLNNSENRSLLEKCDVVFIAVPTPTTPQGFNCDILKEVVAYVGSGKIAVIKSTMMPGTCEKIQDMYPDRFLFHSPEFLTEKNAAYDVAHPTRNIVGYAIDSPLYHEKAAFILSLLPSSPLNMVCHSREAELIKYGSNNFLFLKVIYCNILYDIAQKNGMNWEKIFAGIVSDPRIGESHMRPFHASGNSDHDGRGAGGHSFIKDFAGFCEYASLLGLDAETQNLLRSAEKKNIRLLRSTQKDIDLLRGVYGEDIIG